VLIGAAILAIGRIGDVRSSTPAIFFPSSASHVSRSAFARDFAPSLTMERREDGPPVRLPRLALIVAALNRCGGPRGGLARRRRRGPEGLGLDPRQIRVIAGW
jgi:hypothetical protein